MKSSLLTTAALLSSLLIAGCSSGSDSAKADCSSLLGKPVQGQAQIDKACKDVGNTNTDFSCTVGTDTVSAWWVDTGKYVYVGREGAKWGKFPHSTSKDLGKLAKAAGCDSNP